MKGLLLTLTLALLASPAVAQPTVLDRPFAPLPTAAERHAADVASWVTVGTAVGLDVVHGCSEGPSCRRALVLAGVRVGVTASAGSLLKVLLQRERPCAPSCGADNPHYSFPSGHTAFAFSAVGGPRLAVMVPLAVGTGGLRVAAGKHWLTDTLGGAAIGLLTSRIR